MPFSGLFIQWIYSSTTAALYTTHEVHLNIPAVFILLNICSAKTAQSLLIGEAAPRLSLFCLDTLQYILYIYIYIVCAYTSSYKRDKAAQSPPPLLFLMYYTHTHTHQRVCEMILSNRIQSSAVVDACIIFVHIRSIEQLALQSRIFSREIATALTGSRFFFFFQISSVKFVSQDTQADINCHTSFRGYGSLKMLTIQSQNLRDDSPEFIQGLIFRSGLFFSG